MNSDGARLASRRLSEGLPGVRGFHELVAAHVAEPSQVVIGIETDRGLWVQALSAAGYRVYAVNPLAVTHYLATYGSSRVSKAVMMGAIPPFLLKTDENPDGVEQSVFDDIKAAVIADRPAYFENFLNNSYNVDVLAGTRVSDQAWHNSFNVALAASAHAAHACIDTWLTDFRDDLPMIDVPVLLIHGDADRILPYPNTAKRLPGLIKDLTVLTVKGGPHNIAWTHPDVVNPALLDFLKK
jgi:non-heme chloroperoxidase